MEHHEMKRIVKNGFLEMYFSLPEIPALSIIVATETNRIYTYYLYF
jgi:hypothetical protein